MGETNNNPLVEFCDVSYCVPSISSPIISNLNLTVNCAETLVLLGESGCGKTTTLKLVNRLLLPTTGKVLVEGTPTTEWNPIRLRRRTGYVIQEAGRFPHFSVARNVGLVPALEGLVDVPDLIAMAAPKAVMVVSGTEDPLFPPLGIREAHRQIAAAYQWAGAAERRIRPGGYFRRLARRAVAGTQPARGGAVARRRQAAP